MLFKSKGVIRADGILLAFSQCSAGVRGWLHGLLHKECMCVLAAASAARCLQVWGYIRSASSDHAIETPQQMIMFPGQFEMLGKEVCRALLAALNSLSKSKD